MNTKEIKTVELTEDQIKWRVIADTLSIMGNDYDLPDGTECILIKYRERFQMQDRIVKAIQPIISDLWQQAERQRDTALLREINRARMHLDDKNPTCVGERVAYQNMERFLSEPSSGGECSQSSDGNWCITHNKNGYPCTPAGKEDNLASTGGSNDE